MQMLRRVALLSIDGALLILSTHDTSIEQDYRDKITPPGYKNSATRNSAIAILIFYYLQRETLAHSLISRKD